MTRTHLAAAAALSLPALLVTASLGLAQEDRSYRITAGCKTKHTDTRDLAKIKTTVKKVDRPGGKDGDDRKPPRRGTAAALVPVEGAKVITKLIDLTGENNVVGKAKKKKLTNKDGVAKTKHEFNAFGNYRVKVKVKVNGDVVGTDVIDFGVRDRESGACDPPIAGAG